MLSDRASALKTFAQARERQPSTFRLRQLNCGELGIDGQPLNSTLLFVCCAFGRSGASAGSSFGGLGCSS